MEVSFSKQLKKVIESAVLKLVSDGQFIMPSYERSSSCWFALWGILAAMDKMVATVCS